MSTEQTPDDLGYAVTWPAPTARAPLVFAIPPGTPEKACRSCAARIFWIDTKGGRRMPLNVDGTSHFASCPDADAHRKPKPSNVILTTTERRVLGLVYEGVAVPIRQENRFALASLGTKKLIILENGMRWIVTDLGKVAAAPKKRAVRHVSASCAANVGASIVAYIPCRKPAVVAVRSGYGQRLVVTDFCKACAEEAERRGCTVDWSQEVS